MTPSIKGTLAAGLAAATILSGLSFGPAAASAAPAEKKSSKSATHTVVGTMPLIFDDGGTVTAMARESASNGWNGALTYSSLATAQAQAPRFTVTKLANGYYTFKEGNACLAANISATDPGFFQFNDSWCGRDHSEFKLADGFLQTRSEHKVGKRRALPLAPNRFFFHYSNPIRMIGDLGPISPTTPLTASVTSVDNAAKSAVIGGTATKGAEIRVGSQKVTANATNGSWSMTLTGLNVGSNPKTVEQYVGGTKIDQKALTITITATSSGLVASTQGTATLDRDAAKAVETGITATAAGVTSMEGTTIFTAPAGTTFAAGQTTLPGEWMNPGGSWAGSAALALTGGRLSDGNTKLTFDTDFSLNTAAGVKMRWSPRLSVTSGAAAGNGTLGYVFAGSTNFGTYNVHGSTATVIPAVVTPPAEGSFLVAVKNPVALDREKPTEVESGLVAIEAGITSMQGKAVFTAPEGTTFSAGQTELWGQYRQPNRENWAIDGEYDLTNGVRSNGGRTLTYDSNITGLNSSVGTQYRWLPKVEVNSGAAGGTGTLSATFTGSTNKSGYNVSGPTPTTIEESNVDLTALLQSTDHLERSAVIGGMATPDATIRVGGQTVTANESGDWTMTVSDLEVGANEIVVEQLVGGTKYDEESLTVTILENGGIVGTTNGPVSLARDGDTPVVAGLTIKADAFNTVRNSTMVFTAPEGTTFKEGQTALAGQYKHPDADWSGNHPFLTLRNGSLSDDKKTLTFTSTTFDVSAFTKDAQLRWSPIVQTSADVAAGDGRLGFTFSGTSNNGAFNASGRTSTVIHSALVAAVQKVNNIAKTAVIGGTATPGATVKVGSQEVTANAETGAWTMTITGLDLGPQNRTVEQYVDSKKVDQKVLSITIAENGTIVPGTSPAVEITAGETKAVQVLATANGAVRQPDGTIVFTAPEGTTFPVGQNEITGAFQTGGTGNWTTQNNMKLTGGVRSADGKTYTYNWKPADNGSPQWNVITGTNVRWSINVAANADATVASTSLGFVLAGDAVQGDFRAQGSTTVNVAADEVRPLTVRVDSVDSNARSARVSGNATPNAEIRVGTSVIGMANASGAWSGTVTGLTVGANDVLFEQFIRNEKANDVRQVINVAEQVVPFTVTSPVHESTIVAPDRQVTFQGTGQPGGKVSIMYGARLIGKVDSIPANGEWSFTATMNYFDYEMTVFYKKSATGGLTSQQPLNVNVTSGVSNRPFEIVTPTNNSTIGAPDKQVTFSGNGTPGARVSIMHGARSIGSETVGAAGTWSFTATMNYAEYNLTAYYKRTPSSDVYQVPLKITVNAGETGFAIGTPAEGGTVTAGTFNVAGTGKVGSRVSVFLNGSSRGSAATNAAGDWTIPVTVNTPGTYTFDVYYKANPTSDYADLVPLTLTVIR